MLPLGGCASGAAGWCEINIYNPIGQIIYTKQISASDGNINETISIPNNNLTSGMYFIRISDGIHTSEQKLIINQP